jgi:hypothetical protein
MVMRIIANLRSDEDEQLLDLADWGTHPALHQTRAEEE